jgi:hypothetical protein
MFINNQNYQHGRTQNIIDKLNIGKNSPLNINYFYISLYNNNNSNPNNKNNKVQIELNDLENTNLDISLPIKDEIFCCKIEKRISTFQEMSHFAIKISVLCIISYIIYTFTDLFSDVYNQIIPEIKNTFHELHFQLKTRNGILEQILNNLFIFGENMLFFIVEKCFSDEMISLLLFCLISLIFYNCCVKSKKPLFSPCVKELTEYQCY